MMSGSVDRYIYMHINVSCKTNKSDFPSTPLNQTHFLILLGVLFFLLCWLLPYLLNLALDWKSIFSTWWWRNQVMMQRLALAGIGDPQRTKSSGNSSRNTAHRTGTPFQRSSKEDQVLSYMVCLLINFNQLSWFVPFPPGNSLLYCI